MTLGILGGVSGKLPRGGDRPRSCSRDILADRMHSGTLDHEGPRQLSSSPGLPRANIGIHTSVPDCNA